MLTPFGRSARPVATIAAPLRFASSGRISGSGSAKASTMASRAMPAIASPLSALPEENPTKTSAPASTAGSEPCLPSRLVHRAISAFTQFIRVGRYL